LALQLCGSDKKKLHDLGTEFAGNTNGIFRTNMGPMRMSAA